MAEPNYDDFLKRTGAIVGAAPDYSDFLKRTGAAIEAPPPEPDKHWSAGTDNEYGITGDPQQFNGTKGLDLTPAARRLTGTDRPGDASGDTVHPDLRSAIAPAPGTTYGQVLPFARDDKTGEMRFALPSSLRDLATGGLDLIEGPTTGTVTPDATNLLAAAAMGGKLTPSVVTRDMAMAAGDATRAPLSPEFKANPFAPGAENKLAEAARNPPPGDAIPTMTVRPGESAPGPQSVGAAASRDNSPPGVIDMTPAQVQAYRSTAEGSKLLESQQPGVADTNEYVPGVRASTAEVEQTVNAAREAKDANIKHPEVSQAARDQAAANNEARQRYQQSTFKSPVDVNNAIEARAAQAETDLAATWKNKTDADAQPVIDAASEIKASPDGRRPVVRSAVDAVTNELYGADGKLLTDPEQLYGVRKHIDDLLSKEAGATDPKSQRAAANLMQLKTSLDGVIEQAAPGFKQYLKNFSDASRPIDEMQVLQGHESKFYDTQGRMQLSRVQTMMRNIVDSRNAPGINPYKSISDETMQRLWALRDDLRRSASAQELARTPGSDTAQNLFDLMKRTAGAGADLVAMGAAHKVAPIVGPIIYNAVKGGIANKRAAGAQQRGVTQGLSNLNPNRLRPMQPD